VQQTDHGTFVGEFFSETADHMKVGTIRVELPLDSRLGLNGIAQFVEDMLTQHTPGS
jgi:hypothetical protein